jgi:glycosyltransferase involved in cell wall biosynthesis
MDDESRRSRMGKLGRARVEQELAWSYQRRAYLSVYRGLVGDTTTTDQTGG